MVLEKDVNITKKHRISGMVYEVGIHNDGMSFYKNCASLDEAITVRDNKLKEWSLL